MLKPRSSKASSMTGLLEAETHILVPMVNSGQLEPSGQPWTHNAVNIAGSAFKMGVTTSSSVCLES